MIWFSADELLASIFSSLIYGGFFAFLVCFLSLLSTLLSNGRLTLAKALMPKGKPIKPSALTTEARGGISSALIIILIVLFTVGYILLSYYALDGSVRVYTLVLSLASLFLTRFLVSSSLSRIVLFLINRILSIMGLLLYIILFPYRVIYCKILKKKEVGATDRQNLPITEKIPH